MLRAAAGGLAVLLVIPLATAALLGRNPPAHTPGMRAFPVHGAPALSRLPVADFPAGAGGGELVPPGQRNPHHPCLTVAEWVIALHSTRKALPDENCRLAKGSWTGLFTGRSTDDPSEITLLPAIPAHLAVAAGLKDRPEDLMRWRTPAREDAWLWMPVLVSASEQRAGRSIEEWRPARDDLACSYARRWLAAKVTFRLAVRPEERTALARILARCGG